MIKLADPEQIKHHTKPPWRNYYCLVLTHQYFEQPHHCQILPNWTHLRLPKKIMFTVSLCSTKMIARCHFSCICVPVSGMECLLPSYTFISLVAFLIHPHSFLLLAGKQTLNRGQRRTTAMIEGPGIYCVN